MEPVGLAVGIVGLAGLFSVCLETINRIDSYKHFGVESRSIIVQFEADKLLFKKWSSDVGLDKSNRKEDFQNELDNPEINLIARKILLSIQEIFTDADGTLSRLQSTEQAGPFLFPPGIKFPDTNKSNTIYRSVSKRDMIGWSFRSKTRLVFQVQQFGALVQRLYSLVPPKQTSGSKPLNISMTGGNDNLISIGEYNHTIRIA